MPELEPKEPFSWMKAFNSLFSGMDWFKAFMVGIKILGILFIAFTIYRAWFMATQKQTQQTHVTVQPGGTMNLVQSQTTTVKKRPWWLPIVFVEGYGFAESDGRTGLGARAGGRFEW